MKPNRYFLINAIRRFSATATRPGDVPVTYKFHNHELTPWDNKPNFPSNKEKRRNHKILGGSAHIMSAEDWGYQWSHQQALLHGPLNPTLSEFVPQPQLLTPNSNEAVDNDTPAGAELDSPPYSPAPLQSPAHSPSPDPNIPVADAEPSQNSRSKNKKKKNKRNEITPPSKASGGVPNPTPEYLARASIPPFLLPFARKILVVIDLNGTLLYRPNPKNPTHFIERPYAKEFLRYCINTFKVVIWSSAKPANVDRMVNQLIESDLLPSVVAIWGRNRFNLTEHDFNARTMCYKRLTKLWADPQIAAAHPEAAAGKNWSQADTLLVDDSLEKARSEPYNLVPIPEFDGNCTEDQVYILPQVHDYINACARQADVSTYIRSRPFQPVPGWRLG
ncbi:HAD-like domain-containing protein [Hypomontagnella monticulosa]|nr:HAD-like domain-containing protein [Hypomontagnella monticulosa]